MSGETKSPRKKGRGPGDRRRKAQGRELERVGAEITFIRRVEYWCPILTTG